MIFLIEYNRSEGNIVTFRSLDDSQRRDAENARLDIELDLNRKGVDHEVVLLEAESEDALRLTHRRYFEDLRQILSKKMEIPDFGPVLPRGGGLNSDTELVQ
jgi:hypothetical protein